MSSGAAAAEGSVQRSETERWSCFIKVDNAA